MKYPLSWLVKNKHVMYCTSQDSRKEYYPLFSYLRETIFEEKLKDENEKPIFSFDTGLKFLRREGKDDITFSVDMAAFKCKPTTMERPPQILITFNPPLSISNNLFSPLKIIRERE